MVRNGQLFSLIQTCQNCHIHFRLDLVIIVVQKAQQLYNCYQNVLTSILNMLFLNNNFVYTLKHVYSFCSVLTLYKDYFCLSSRFRASLLWMLASLFNNDFSIKRVCRYFVNISTVDIITVDCRYNVSHLNMLNANIQ